MTSATPNGLFMSFERSPPLPAVNDALLARLRDPNVENETRLEIFNILIQTRDIASVHELDAIAASEKDERLGRLYGFAAAKIRHNATGERKHIVDATLLATRPIVINPRWTTVNLLIGYGSGLAARYGVEEARPHLLATSRLEDGSAKQSESIAFALLALDAWKEPDAGRGGVWRRVIENGNPTFRNRALRELALLEDVDERNVEIVNALIETAALEVTVRSKQRQTITPEVIPPGWVPYETIKMTERDDENFQHALHFFWKKHDPTAHAKALETGLLTNHMVRELSPP